MGIRCVTSECNLDLDLLRIELKINEIETSYIIIHKIYFIFLGGLNFGGPVRSHSPHGLWDAPDATSAIKRNLPDTKR